MKESAPEKIVRVYHANRSQGSFQHGPYTLGPGGFADVPESVANLWLEHKSCGIPLVTLQEAPLVNAKAKEENDALRAEKARLEKEHAEITDAANRAVSRIEELSVMLAGAREESQGAAAERKAREESELKNKELADRLAGLEKLLADMKAAGGVKIPVVEDQAPGESAPAETVLTGEALKVAQAKAAKKR